MSALTSASLPSWLKRSLALRGAALLSFVLMLLAAGFIALEYRQQSQFGRNQNELLVQALDVHIGQTLKSIDLALLGMSQSIAGQAEPPQTSALNAMLALSASKMPEVRSFSLLDAQGQVLASSSDANVGRSISLRQLTSKSQSLPAGLGPLLAGQDLADLKDLNAKGLSESPPHAPSQANAPRAASMLTLSLAQQTSDGVRFWVAVVRPEYFASIMDKLVQSHGQHLAVVNLEGRLLAASQGLSLEAGTLALNHTVFKDLLPQQSSGGYSAMGLGGMPSNGSFQRHSEQPLMLLVELPREQIWSRMQGYAQAVVLMTITGLALMAALGALAWRALGAYEQAKRELVSAHQNLANKERDQSLLIENVQELMFHTDANGLLQFINHVEILGLENAQACVGQPFENLIDERDRAKARGLFRRTTGFLNLPLALRLASQNGRQRVLEVVVTAIKASDQAAAGFVGFGLDVTEREDARQRLQTQLDFTARLIDVCPVPIFAKDKALRYLMVNHAWSDMTGVDKNLAIGRKLSELRPASLAEQIELQDARLVAQGGSEHSEIRERERDFLNHQSVFTDAEGNIAGLLGSAIDISRFVEAERQIGEARDAAERANNIKTEFVANMSHELRTPLQSIIGFSELGVERSGANARLQDMFARIHTSGQRMLELVNNLLDLSRLESTVGHLVLTEQPLSPLIEALVAEYAEAADKRSIKLKLQLPEHPLAAAADAGRLQQALGNVLENALRLAPSASQVSIQLYQDGDQSCISVHDLGPGIPPAELESIFQPFAQSSLTKGGAAGTGLGLAVCRKILLAHGGTVSAHNHVEGGAVFELRLPIC
jgi:PAS domain S-box-containing protein